MSTIATASMSPGAVVREIAVLSAALDAAHDPGRRAELAARLDALSAEFDAVNCLAIASEGSRMLFLARELREARLDEQALVGIGNMRERAISAVACERLESRMAALAWTIDSKLGNTSTHANH